MIINLKWKDLEQKQESRLNDNDVDTIIKMRYECTEGQMKKREPSTQSKQDQS